MSLACARTDQLIINKRTHGSQRKAAHIHHRHQRHQQDQATTKQQAERTQQQRTSIPYSTSCSVIWTLNRLIWVRKDNRAYG